MVGDLRVCRFLRSKQGDVKEAADWFRQFLQWRVESNIEADRQQVIGRSPEDFCAWYVKRKNPYLHICPYAGRNEEGHVIWYMRQGLIDPKKFVEHRQISMEEDSKLMFLVLEWTLWYLNVLSKEEGRMVYAIKVADFKGMGSEGRSLPIFVPKFKDFLVNLVKTMQKYYCEHDSAFLIVNTPFIFRAVFSVMKVVLTKRQSSKMSFLGDPSKADARGSMAELLNSEVMPTEYGGALERAPGAFPLPTAAETDAWYRDRHQMPVELVEASSAKAS